MSRIDSKSNYSLERMFLSLSLFLASRNDKLAKEKKKLNDVRTFLLSVDLALQTFHKKSLAVRRFPRGVGRPVQKILVLLPSFHAIRELRIRFFSQTYVYLENGGILDRFFR